MGSDVTTFLSCAKAAMRDLVPRVLSTSIASPNSVETKPDGSLVTVVDKIVEAELVTTFSTVFPDTPVLGEEGAIDSSYGLGVSQSELYTQFMRAPRQVIIDPIDGTRNFVDRKREYCIAAALSRSVSGGIWPVASVIAVPEEGLMYWCDEDGAYVEEISSGELRRLNAGELSKATHVSISSRDRSWLTAQGFELNLPWVSSGSSVYDLLGTACGRLRGSVVGSQRLWDLMAPLALASRLGFLLCDLCSGERIGALAVSDLSSDIEARPWGLGRRMVVMRPGDAVSAFFSRAAQ